MGALRSLPANATDSVRLLGRIEAGMFDAALPGDVGSRPFESALPVRSFFAWPGKRNYEGSWWSSTVRAHVGFESLLERDFLMLADHDEDVAGIASQPFALLWPQGTEGAAGMSRTSSSALMTASDGLWMYATRTASLPRSAVRSDA